MHLAGPTGCNGLPKNNTRKQLAIIGLPVRVCVCDLYFTKLIFFNSNVSTLGQTMNTPIKRDRKRAFSIIESLMATLIVAIIGFAVAPYVQKEAAQYDSKKCRQQLAILREAIKMYHSRYDVYPGEHELPEAMQSMITGRFPIAELNGRAGNNEVYYDMDPIAIKPVTSDPQNGCSWAYKPINGTLKLNLENSHQAWSW